MWKFNLKMQLICIAFVNMTFANVVSNNFPISWTGTNYISKSEFDTALQTVLKDTLSKDTAAKFFKLAYIHKNLGNYSKALFYYRFASSKNDLITPLAYGYIGEIEHKLGRIENSLVAYRTVLQYNIPNRYKYSIFEKMHSVLKDDTSGLNDLPWLDEYKTWAVSHEKVSVPEASYLDTLVLKRKWSKIDSLLSTMKLRGNNGGKIADLIISANPRASDLKSTTFFSLASASYSCKRYKKAEQLLNLSKKGRNFSRTVSKRSVLFLETQLNFQAKNYHKTISLGKNYIKKYGNDSDIIPSLARSYRNIGKSQESNYWYDLYTKVFPNHSYSQEIVWLKAWQFEDDKQWKQAAAQYKKILTQNTKGKRIDESHLRHALCHYRIGQYDSAQIFLERFTKSNQSSSFFLAACYWTGKCQLARNRRTDAKLTFTNIIRTEPHDYYAHRASQVLETLGDTLSMTVDTSFTLDYTLSWLDSISPSSAKKELSAEDSINYLRGLYLTSIGDIVSADYFLEPLELSFPGNLVLQFKLAWAYTVSDAPAEAYRIARRLSWRIPQSERGKLPLQVYSLLYPPFFSDYISSQATLRNVDPLLVSAVIRQESIFNPTIMSPVGATGLMQIMPYTGEYIAKKLDEKFDKDSLSHPYANIRFGVYYLKELLDQFDNDKVMALASYNAGPHNAKKWYKLNEGKEFDLFVEDVGFTETRNYVKKVLGNYWTYHQLVKSPYFTYGHSEKNGLVLNISDSNIPEN